MSEKRLTVEEFAERINEVLLEEMGKPSPQGKGIDFIVYQVIHDVLKRALHPEEPRPEDVKPIVYGTIHPRRSQSSYYYAAGDGAIRYSGPEPKRGTYMHTDEGVKWVPFPEEEGESEAG